MPAEDTILWLTEDHRILNPSRRPRPAGPVPASAARTGAASLG